MKRLMDGLTWPFRHLPIPISLLSFILLLLGIGFGLAYYNIQRSYEVIQTWEKESQLELVERMARETDQVFEQYALTVLNVSRSISAAMTLTGPEGAYRYFLNQKTLATTIRENPYMTHIAITDGLGRSLLDQSPSSPQINVFESYLETARASGFKGQRYVSPITMVEGYPSPFVIFAEPVQDSGGANIAVVAIVLSLEELINHVFTSSRDVYTLFLCDDRGRLITRTDRESSSTSNAPGTDYSFHPLARKYMENKGRWNELLTYEKDGAPFLGTFSTTRNLPWMVACEIPESVALASVKNMESRLVRWFVLIILISAGLALVITTAFKQPLKQLVSSAKLLIEHDFKQPVPLSATNEFGELAQTFNTMRGSILDYIEQIQAAAKKNKETFKKALQALVLAIDAKDPYTKGHSKRVSKYAVLIGQELGQDDPLLEKTELSALLHDVGKIGIEDKILKKPAPLTAGEFKIMKRHPTKGLEILKEIDALKEISDGVGLHHENWDGKGYPNGLKGKDIPLQARIVAVADAFDAMTTNRPYQIAMDYESAIIRLQDLAGLRFDPEVVQALANAYFAGRLKPA